MEQAGATRYWCHMCSQTVNPIIEIESMKCPICQSGFVEETSSSAPANETPVDVGAPDSDRAALSLWAPILLGMMANPLRHRLGRRLETEDDDHGPSPNPNPNDAVDQELESLIARRRRSSAAILQLLQGIRAGLMLESANLEADNQQPQQREGGGGGGENEGDGDRERDEQQQRMILINPFNQTIIVQGGGSSDPNNRATLGDYFIGPGLEMLMQHLTENDPTRYGTPPAQKEAVEALHTIKVDEALQLQCAVCLEECDVGDEVKEMPCKHKFHSSCILTWLDLHSTCPVCRFQLPADESKLAAASTTTHSGSGANADSAARFSLPLLWPFSTLFSSASQPSPRNETGNGNSSLALPSGSSSTDAPSEDN